VDILGISCFYHDAAAVLLRDGVVVAAAEEERFTRIKHDHAFPTAAIEFCLRTGGITASQLDHVVFYEKPLLKFVRLLVSTLRRYPRSARVFRESMITWLGEKLWMKDLIRRRLGIAPERILFSEHHLSHAASAFLCSPFDEAAILTVDGVGEWATATIGIGRGTDVRILREIRFPHSLGLFYSAFTAFLGFEVNEGEYKVMGMAPFGTPRHVDEVRKLLRVDDEGGFELDMRYFSFDHSSERTYSPRFVELFGPPRDARAPFFTAASGYPSYFGPRPDDFEAQARRNERYADIAASVQHVVEEIMLALARTAHTRTGSSRLCMAGGVALNSVANGRIVRETPFREVFIQPAAGDAGGAMGAALFAYHTLLGKPRGYVLDDPYLGETHDGAPVAAFLEQASIPHETFDDPDKLIDRVVDALVAGKVVGWSQGRFEWGPRALGHRSILADPRRADMKDVVNTKIKFREPYRPFAPAVIAERVGDYFEIDPRADYSAARFMLVVAPVRAEQRRVIPAVTHVDGSGRLQTVSAAITPRFHRLIERFGEATGVPVLLNTSFNLRGEPIVNTPREAFNSFNRSDMDLLVLGDRLIDKAT
jgi:carbamoyltransferase